MRLSFHRMLLAAAVTVAAAAPTARAQGFKVIVNADNPVSTLTRDQLSRFFLRPSSWEDGSSVAAVDLEETSEIRHHFSQAVLHRDVAAVKAGWMQQMFAGRGVPPALQPNDSSVGAFVSHNPKAIGYVSATAELPAHVKVVHVNEQ